MLNSSELINRPGEELEALYESLCREIFNLMNELRLTRRLEKPHLLREKKRDRARVLTALRRKKLALEHAK